MRRVIEEGSKPLVAVKGWLWKWAWLWKWLEGGWLWKWLEGIDTEFFLNVGMVRKWQKTKVLQFAP